MSSPASGHIPFKSDSGEVGEVGEVGEYTGDGELKESAHAQERDAEETPTEEEESAVPSRLKVEEGGVFREGCLVRVVPDMASGGDVRNVEIHCLIQSWGQRLKPVSPASFAGNSSFPIRSKCCAARSCPESRCPRNGRLKTIRCLA